MKIFGKVSFLRSPVASTLKFVIFCLLSSSVYILNDVFDVEKDRYHPKKSKRPIASGRIKIKAAIIFFVVLSLFSLTMGFYLNKAFFFAALIYFLLQILYSLKLKHIPILDVFVILRGFLFVL